MASLPRSASVPLARQAREQFVAGLEAGLGALADALRASLLEQLDGAPGPRERQEFREALSAFEQSRSAWIAGVRNAWRRALVPPTATGPIRLDQLELIGDQVLENKILASRLAAGVHDRVQWDLNDLKLRILHLEGIKDLPSEDILRPEAAAQLLVEQWRAADLTAQNWACVKAALQQALSQCALDAYQRANQFLVDHGVLPEIELSSRVKRSAQTTAKTEAPSDVRPAASGLLRSNAQTSEESPPRSAVGAALARARVGATGVLGQLRRLLSEKVSGFEGRAGGRPSPRLAQALARNESQLLTDLGSQLNGQAVVPSDLQRVARDLRERSAQLKQSAETSAEKATIEIVALMFQSILSEERIPPALRVWFARLQMPVLRVALAEPEFFSSLAHPARQLIDRMGACALGFDTSAISGSALEAEIRRVVQVIEQYPETGQRVFELVHQEFEDFLSRFLIGSAPTQRLISVAQQVEQKETLAIQYTIELRKMLSDVPVGDHLREFLFKVWAEVLALAAIKHGPQHPETVSLKKAASDLVWAACAKPSREERAKVLSELPDTLLKLSLGMSLLGLSGPEQQVHIRVITEAVADAFRSRMQGMAPGRIEELAKRLANLEEFVSEDATADLPLDQDSIELILGIDASMIEVITAGAAMADPSMLSRARELQPGNWFTLDHNGSLILVQYVWRSERCQLHLFTSADGRSYLVQLHRLAAYLQSGLLVPSEEEALTVRATRDALAKLDANPERLLH